MQQFELAIVALGHRAREIAARVQAGADGEEGQTTAEYVAVIVLIAGLVLAVTQSDTIMQSIESAIDSAFGEVENNVTDGDEG